MTSSFLRFAIAHLAALALASAALFAGVAKAQSRPAAGYAAWPPLSGGPEASGYGPGTGGAAAGQTVMVDLGGPVGAARSLALPRGKSAIIDLPVDARDVLVSDPKVANVILSTPRRIYVMGVAAGQTDAVFIDAVGHQILRLNVHVDQDVTVLGQTLNRILPGSSVHAEAVNDNVILTGEVPSASDADKALRIAASFVADPKQILNMITVAEPEQVMLKVRIVEVNRQIIKQLGVNLNAMIGKVGDTTLNLASSSAFAVNGGLVSGLTGGASYSNSTGTKTAEGVLAAFERVGLIRTLAEPNLTAVSGESAKFLAGGEFPVPVGEDNTGRITVDFKQFGVGLGFTPVVLSKGRISLKISTEYSELTNVGALTQAGTTTTNTPTTGTSGTSGSTGTTSSGTTSSGTGTTSSGTTSSGSNTVTTPSVTIPGLTVRRAETVVELPSGGSMMIAGLLQSVTSSDIDALPGLMQLPVLGALFRSRDYQQNETELVVVVTPYLVKSVRPDQIQTPADGLQMADDLSTVLLGQINKGFDKPAPPPPGKTYQGPFGYVVE